MLGDFIIKILVLVLGYLYPAFECFRTIEHNRPNTDQLLFWCQYWVIMAILTAVEKFGDIFVSWLPLYGESKLAFIVYLWHPRTMGTDYVYGTFLRPFMVDHETDIDMRMKQIMGKTGDLLIFYFKNFVDKGQSMAFEILDFVLSKSRRSSPPRNEGHGRPSVPPRDPPPLSDRRNRRQSSPPPPLAPRPSAPPLEQLLPRPTVSYPPVNDYDDGDMTTQVNRVEEALRAAGVNLPGLRRRQ